MATLIVENADTKTRIVGMKWLKLGEAKDPQFGERYFLVDKDGDFYTGSLNGINQTKAGIEYSFDLPGVDEPVTNITHYCVPKSPL